MAEKSAAIWTQYWKEGRADCFTGELPETARVAIDRAWRKFFLRLPAGAKIVDLAAGAGYVARLAAQHGDFDITCADIADMPHQEAKVNSSTLRLSGNVDLSELPFADECFDVAVSQFGIEYSDLSAAIAEVARVLKSDGVGQFIIHHTQSAISSATRARLVAFETIIGDGSVFDTADSMFGLFGDSAPQSETLAAVTKFRSQMQTLRTNYSRQFKDEPNVGEIVAFLSDLARTPHLFDPADARRRIVQARTSIEAWVSRQKAQLAAAQDSLDSVRDHLHQHGLDTTNMSEISDSQVGVLAWKIMFARRND